MVNTVLSVVHCYGGALLIYIQVPNDFLAGGGMGAKFCSYTSECTDQKLKTTSYLYLTHSAG